MLPAALFAITFGIIEIASLMLPFEPAAVTSAGTSLHYLVSAGVVVLLLSSASVGHRVRANAPTVTSNLRWFCVVERLSFLGLFILVVNTLVFRGISYEEGIQTAREVMRAERSGPPDWTIVISVAGNLLVSGSYLVIGAAVSLSNEQRHFSGVFLRQWIIIIGYALLVGGREPVWIGLGFMAGAAGLRLSSFRSVLPRQAKIRVLTTLLLAIVVSAWIAQLRIGRYDGRFDIVQFCQFLGGAARDGVTPEVMIPGPAAAVAAYLAHPRWLSIETFSSTDPVVGSATLRVAASSLSRIESLALPHSQPPSFHGRWIPVAASFWYDLKWMGLVVLAIICLVVGRLYRRASNDLAQTSSPNTAAWGALCGCLCFTAPLQSAFESVPFVYAAVLLVAITTFIRLAPTERGT